MDHHRQPFDEECSQLWPNQASLPSKAEKKRATAKQILSGKRLATKPGRKLTHTMSSSSYSSSSQRWHFSNFFPFVTFPPSRKRKGEKFKEGSNSQRAERVSGQEGGRGSSQGGTSDEVDLRLDDSRGLEFPFCILTISQSHMTLTFAGSASSHLPWGSPLLSSASDSFSHWILFLLLG